MLEWAEGWIFVGLDGRLYRVAYEPDGGWYVPEDHEYVNGWTVDLIRPEMWERAFPLWRE